MFLEILILATYIWISFLKIILSASELQISNSDKHIFIWAIFYADEEGYIYISKEEGEVKRKKIYIQGGGELDRFELKRLSYWCKKLTAKSLQKFFDSTEDYPIADRAQVIFKKNTFAAPPPYSKKELSRSYEKWVLS